MTSKAVLKVRPEKALGMGHYSKGFTYFGILLTVALLGTSISAIGVSWSVQKRRAAENQLIWVGGAFRRAIASYYNHAPNGAHQYPRRLQDLLADTRGPRPIRHMREIYPDPLTRKVDWNIVRLPDGAIIGVSSTATEAPLKQSNFGVWEASFENAACYCDWQFVYLPQLVSASPLTQ